MVGDGNEYSKHAPITFSVKTNHTTYTALTNKTKTSLGGAAIAQMNISELYKIKS